ncbi:MAG TPA: PIG-L family deacetylase [Candidatus Binatia bacterium]|jgi:LmbE family N-acetylglucosaminyl deacetylase
MFASRDRLMVLAPHPDDESLATAGLLQRAAARGAATRVVFATDGDDNPWPQRIAERRIWIGDTARARWGVRRRGESRAALAALGLPEDAAIFLGFPDRGLTSLLLERAASVVRALTEQIVAWRPSVLAMPSLRDRHPDHNALAVLALDAIAGLPVDERPIVLTYVVHPPDAAVARTGLAVRLESAERDRKAQAVACHAAQLCFHRRTARRAVTTPEHFAIASAPVSASAPRAIRAASCDHGVLRLRLDGWAWRWRGATILVVGRDRGRSATFRVRLLAGRARVLVQDGTSGAVVGCGYRTFRDGETIVAAGTPWAPGVTRFFVKLVTHGVFFDREGWVEGAVRGREPESGLQPSRVDLRGWLPAQALS